MNNTGSFCLNRTKKEKTEQQHQATTTTNKNKTIKKKGREKLQSVLGNTCTGIFNVNFLHHTYLSTFQITTVSELYFLMMLMVLF